MPLLSPYAQEYSPPLANLPADVLAAAPLFEDADGDNSATMHALEDIPVPLLFQLRRTYLLYEHDEGVVLIDQHSAHERVLYEQFMEQLTSGGATSQRLLIPETIHLSPRDGESLEAHRDAFARLGFELEAFGGHSVIVHAVPMPHRRFDALKCLRCESFD